MSSVVPVALSEEISLLDRISKLNLLAIEEVQDLLGHPAVPRLTIEYSENLKKRDVDMGFNLFALISDLYFRENFHSDILMALLDPKGKHEFGEKYLHLFLDFLNLHGSKINLGDYSNARVEREVGAKDLDGRIDILISDNKSKKAIIIENKINNAGDMPRQLPRYLEIVKKREYSCDVIIYLRLNGIVGPDMTNWTDQEKCEVKALLKVVCAYEESDMDLLNGWILRCENQSLSGGDAKSIIRQYGSLITKLGGNIMNKPIMKKFYEIIVQGNNLETALSLKGMIDDLVLYRAENILDQFKSNLTPFKAIKIHALADVYFTECHYERAHLGIDIWAYEKCYVFQFWDRNRESNEIDYAKEVLLKMECLDEYNQDLTEGSHGRWFKSFLFPQEEAELIAHTKAFKDKLSDFLSQG